MTDQTTEKDLLTDEQWREITQAIGAYGNYRNGVARGRTERVIAAVVAEAKAEITRRDDEIQRLRRLIVELSDSDPCSWDHNHSCQTHGYFYLPQGETCPQFDAQVIAGEQYLRDVRETSDD